MRHKTENTTKKLKQVPAGECFMIRFDAGAAVPSYRPGLDGGQACGGGGGGPSGRDPPQKTRVEAPSQTLYTQDICTHD